MLVVHAQDGLDEISIGSATEVAELKDGQVSCYQISPQQFDIGQSKLDEIVVRDVTQSLQLVNEVFSNKSGAALDIVKLNAGAALYASDKASTLAEGIEMAATAIASGDAKSKFQQYIEYTNNL